MVKVNQYDIVIVNLDPTIGSEIKKTRPCVVISPNEMNRNLKTVVIAPMTTTNKLYPTRLPIIFDQKNGWIAIDQIKTIDQSRIHKVVGKLETQDVLAVKKIIFEAYVE